MLLELLLKHSRKSLINSYSIISSYSKEGKKMVKMSSLENSIKSAAMSLPLIAGSLIGIIIPAEGEYASALEKAVRGDGVGALYTLMANYTFFDQPTGKFKLTEGRGVKGVIVGTIVTKILHWVAD